MSPHRSLCCFLTPSLRAEEACLGHRHQHGFAILKAGNKYLGRLDEAEGWYLWPWPL